jgi:hypothetical protein
MFLGTPTRERSPPQRAAPSVSFEARGPGPGLCQRDLAYLAVWTAVGLAVIAGVMALPSIGLIMIANAMT